MLNLFPMLIYYGLSLIEYPPLDLFTNPAQILYITFYIVIPILLIPLFIYILIICIIARKSTRVQEVGKVRWFSFRLDSTSLVVIFMLSIIDLIFNIRVIFSSIGNLITFLEFYYVPQAIISQLYTSLIVVSITLTFHLYSLIICAMNRSLLR